MTYLFILPLFFSFSAFTQSYHFQQYSVGEGLPQSQVYALYQDANGYLWLGTQGGGLARFDGSTFISYSDQNGLADNYINTIIEDEEGHLWLGSKKGVNLFDGTGFQSFIPANKRDITVQDLAFDQNGTLWAATLDGIYKLGKDSIFQKERRSGSSFGRMYAALKDSRGNHWMAGEKGIFSYNASTAKWEKTWSDNAEVLDLAETPDGKIWAAVFNYGLIRYDGKKWNLEADTNLPSIRLQCLWPAPDGKLWVGTQAAGLFIFEKKRNLKTYNQEQIISRLTTRDGLCNNSIRAITNDRWGNVWIGTSGSGVCKYGGQEFEHITQREGLESDFVYSLANDTSGGLWLSAGDKGVSFFRENNFTHFGKDSGFLNVKCRVIHQDLNGQVWFGTERWGLATFYFTNNSIPQRKFIFFDRENNGLAGNYIRDIISNTKNEIWVATTDGGISHLIYQDSINGKIILKNYDTKEGLSDPNVHALHFDKWGRLWVGTRNRGLGMVFKERVEMLGPASNASNIFIRCIKEDNKGNVWVGTDDRGIGVATIYNDSIPVFNFFAKKDGLSSANIYLLQFDEFDNLWVGSDKGVDKLKLDASGNILNVENYGLAEGFKGVETCQQASILDREGNLWFGTVNGLMRYRPQLDTGKIIKPEVHFTNIKLFYKSLAKTEFSHFFDKNDGIKKSSIFPHNKNHLGFEFFALNFPNPKKTFYSWQLIGSEENWSPFSKRNEVSYSNLPPGDYTFKVRAKNEKDIIGDIIQTSFTIKPPFWQTWWFRIAAASFLILLISTFFWLRIRQVRKKAAQEKVQLEMQNHLLQLEQKARQLQMNPHFIFNALNSIQSLVARKDFDASRSYILKFGKLMRAVLDNSRKEIIPLEKEIDTLQKYLEMEQFCRDGNFDFKINTENIENDDLQIPPMLLQPFVENAILHGVAPLKDRRGMIEINFLENGNNLNVEIKDNGVGINKSPNVGPEEKKRSSAGIAVTKERLAILNGGCVLSNGKDNGTRVIVTIPV